MILSDKNNKNNSPINIDELLYRIEQLDDYVCEDIVYSANNDINNTFALTIQSDYKKLAVRNLLSSSGRISSKIILYFIFLNLLRLFF